MGEHYSDPPFGCLNDLLTFKLSCEEKGFAYLPAATSKTKAIPIFISSISFPRKGVSTKFATITQRISFARERANFLENWLR